ncbi:hypothetical protein ACHUKI_004890, partial [Escherichia coli]
MQGKYLSPSGALTTKPHDSAGAHRRACARIADSVSVMGLYERIPFCTASIVLTLTVGCSFISGFIAAIKL